MPWLGSTRLGLAAAAFALAAAGCAGKSEPASRPPVPSDERAAPPEDDSSNEDLSRLQQALSETEGENARLREERARLEERLAVQSGAMTTLEEENASLELELAIALEELLRTQANLKNVQSRAFAVSRIAEVRVELEALRVRKDPALDDRLDRADSFLQRADQALGDDNVGGAAFLAERAGELVRQSKTIAEVRSHESRELLPIVPPRQIEARAAANLRKGPGADTERVGSVAAGTMLEAVARLGDWFQIRTERGETVWIHRGLVQ